MEKKFDIYRIKEEYKDGFIPKKEHLSNIECWSLLQAYCQLYFQTKQRKATFQQVWDTCVWDGNELYNTEHQITDKRHCVTRLWLTENMILMLEECPDSIYERNTLYRCD